jgi:hypothetical protein
LGKIELAVASTSKSGGTTYLRHEDHIHTTNEAADVQNVTSKTVSESNICTKKVHKQRNQQHKVVLDRIEILPND